MVIKKGKNKIIEAKDSDAANYGDINSLDPNYLFTNVSDFTKGYVYIPVPEDGMTVLVYYQSSLGYAKAIEHTQVGTDPIMIPLSHLGGVRGINIQTNVHSSPMDIEMRMFYG